MLQVPKRDLWYGTRGPIDAPIVLVGESWGAEEAQQLKPFVGSSGTELSRILAEAGIDQRSILFTNMVAEKPIGNETWRLFLPKDSKPERVGGLAPSPLVRSEIQRLYAQIAQSPRALIIATGNWAFWTLSSKAGMEVVRSSNNNAVPSDQQTWAPTGIMNHRGSMWFCEPKPEFCADPGIYDYLSQMPLLPIIHPAAIQRAWYLRAVTVHDLKARVPQALNNDWRAPPMTTAPVEFNSAREHLNIWLASANDARARGKTQRLACDIETVRRRFTSIVGFADSPSTGISIPFILRDHRDGGFDPYWTVEEEAELIRLVRKLLLHPAIRLEGQNFIYDTQFFQDGFGVTPQLDFDSMIAQNVLFPGTPKALEYLSSLFCKYHWYWKEDHKDWNLIGDINLLINYNRIDCMRTYEICTTQRELVKSLGQEAQMAFKMRVNELCLRMMNRGVRIDHHKMGAMRYELSEALNGFYSELEQIIPQDMVHPGHKTRWYRSDKQTKTLLYDLLNMRVVRHPKTGRPTSGKPALMQLEKWYPEFTGLFRRLDYAGSVENTAQVVSTPLDPDGRIRCSFNPAGAETHRLSSSENAFGRGTNLQNLTQGEEDK